MAPPDYGRRPRLAAVIDGGKMEEFFHSTTDRDVVLRWVENGAPESGWEQARRSLERGCIACHYTGASFEVLPLDRYEAAAGAARVEPVLLEKITGGTMGEYLESQEAQQALVSWIEDGAPHQGWNEAKSLLDAHCIHCHNPEGVQGLVSLEVYASVKRLSTLTPISERPWKPPAAVLALSLVGLGLQRRRRRP